jgi:hypothetical protein
MKVRETDQALVIDGLASNDERLQLFAFDRDRGQLADLRSLRLREDVGPAKVIGEGHSKVAIPTTDCASIVDAFQ